MSKPDTKTIVIQTDANNKVCPRSGWLIKIITISNKTKKEYKESTIPNSDSVGHCSDSTTLRSQKALSLGFS